MAIKILNHVDIENTVRFFDSIREDLNRTENWDFGYSALNTENPPRELMLYGGEYNEDKSVYPSNTIFFDSKPATAHISSSVENIIFDTTPPEIISTDFTSIVFAKYTTPKFKGKIVIDSDTLIDLCQFNISLQIKELIDDEYTDKGDPIPLINIKRFGEEEPVFNPYLTNLKINRNNTTYTITFDLDVDYFKDEVKLSSFKMQFYDICGNFTEVIETDTYEWKVIDAELNESNIQHLIIEFVEVYPETKVLSKNIIGYTKVKVSNPNKDLWDYAPHVELAKDSIGTINPFNMNYDKATGTLTFYVTDINKNGSVIVDAWIDFSTINSDIAPTLKALTFAEGILKDFIVQDEGRLYKFRPYIPKYMNEDKYGEFVLFTELFLNTSQKSLNNGNAISTLEKIARINNFNDIDRIENPLLQYYKSQFNFEISPNLNSLLEFLNNKNDIKNGQDKAKQE